MILLVVLICLIEFQVTWPALVREFVESTAQHELNSVKFDDHDLPTTLKKKNSAKKQHETSRLTKIVSSICSSQSLRCIIDIGSGLVSLNVDLPRRTWSFQILRPSICGFVRDFRVTLIESCAEQLKIVRFWPSKARKPGAHPQMLPTKWSALARGSNKFPWNFKVC